MNSGRFWRAALIQLVVVAIPFAILAILLSDDFFEDYGFATGPVVWIACSLVTGRILRLPLVFSLFCAAAGGVAGTLVMLVAGHTIGLLVAIAVFAASASGYDDPAERSEASEPAAQSSIP